MSNYLLTFFLSLSSSLVRLLPLHLLFFKLVLYVDRFLTSLFSFLSLFFSSPKRVLRGAMNRMGLAFHSQRMYELSKRYEGQMKIMILNSLSQQLAPFVIKGS